MNWEPTSKICCLTNGAIRVDGGQCRGCLGQRIRGGRRPPSFAYAPLAGRNRGIGCDAPRRCGRCGSRVALRDRNLASAFSTNEAAANDRFMMDVGDTREVAAVSAAFDAIPKHPAPDLRDLSHFGAMSLRDCQRAATCVTHSRTRRFSDW